MKPQTHSASSPRRATAPPRSRASARQANAVSPRLAEAPRARAADLRATDPDFELHALRPNRGARDGARAPLHLVPDVAAPDPFVRDPLIEESFDDESFDDESFGANSFDADFASESEAEQFERFVKARPAAKAVRAPRRRLARVPCAPCHWGLLVTALLLMVFSLPIVYSASTALAFDQHEGDPYYFLVRQFGFVAAGFAVMLGASRLAVGKLRGLSWALYGVAVAGLILTKFSPLGHSMGNTERWIKLGPVTLQFSELAKIALIGVLADFWSRAARDSQKSAWPWLAAGVIVGVPLVLTLVQPHLSAALVLAMVSLAIAFYAGAPRKHFAAIFAVGAVLLLMTGILCRTGSMPLMKPYQQQRIAAHFGGGGSDEARTSDYQTLQGERAIMRGGVRGVGLGASLYKQGHLPAPHTDFIFAVIGEELGMFGTLGVLALYGALILFCFQTGHAADNAFEALLCAGVGTLIGVQAAGNIGVVSGLLPVTGMPLPILTYGGSGLICAMLGIGLVLAVSRAQCGAE